MIVSIYLQKHEYLIAEPQTLNFGGKYLYSYHPIGKYLKVRRSPNEKYIPGFFNISDSQCKIDLLSAVVGQNGVGKSSVLDIIRKIFVFQWDDTIPDNTSTILVEVDGETKVLSSSYTKVFVTDNTKYDIFFESDFNLQLPEGYCELEKINKNDYQKDYLQQVIRK